MLVKIVTFFLIGMGVLAMFGRLRLPKRPGLSAKKCPDCGAYKIGQAPCPCKDKKR